MEDFIDGLIGKDNRKILEQVGHAVMSGLPAGGLTYLLMWIGAPVAFSAACGFLLGLIGLPYLFGFFREVTQNWGDEPDERTMFMILKMPVNMNMVKDMAAYFVGSAIAAFTVAAFMGG